MAVIGVAFRRTEQPSLRNRLSGTYQFEHAQIVLPTPCTPPVNQKLCSLCFERYGRPSLPPKDGIHRLTYRVTEKEGVTRRVDQNYAPERWEVWFLSTEPDKLRTLLSWLSDQRGKPFNAAARDRYEAYAHFLCCVPFACLPLCASGVHDGRQPNASGTWFCTELCIASLHRMGLLLHVSACATPPDKLADLVAALPGARRV